MALAATETPRHELAAALQLRVDGEWMVSGVVGRVSCALRSGGALVAPSITHQYDCRLVHPFGVPHG